MSNENRRPPSSDVFHLSFLFTMLALAYVLGWAFGFSVGSVSFGSLFAIGVSVWAIVAITDYFKR